MADPYTGEIRIFPFDYAPLDWAFCNGQTMQIQQNNVLFAIIGIQFGGDGKTTFQLPNFQGCAPIHQGTGTGLTPQVVGEESGNNTVTLLMSEMPYHNHNVISYTAGVTNVGTPTNALYISRTSSGNVWSDQSPNTTLAIQTVQNTGGSNAHENRQPYLALNFCICLYGNYPPRPS